MKFKELLRKKKIHIGFVYVRSIKNRIFIQTLKMFTSANSKSLIDSL